MHERIRAADPDFAELSLGHFSVFALGEGTTYSDPLYRLRRNALYVRRLGSNGARHNENVARSLRSHPIDFPQDLEVRRSLPLATLSNRDQKAGVS